MDSWHLTKTYFWEEAPFFRLLLPLILSIALYDATAIKQLPLWLLVTCSIVLLVLFVIVSFVKTASAIIQTSRFFIAQCLLFFVGLLICYTNNVVNSPTWFGNKIDSQYFYLATVTQAPVEKEKTFKVTVNVSQVSDSGRFEPVSGQAIVYIYKYESRLSLKEGDEILLPGKWQKIKNSGNPFEFDYATYAARNNLYYVQFLAPKEVITTPYKTPVSTIRKCHAWCMAQLDRYISDPATKGLMQAMIVGDDVNMDSELRQSYVDTGIIHVVAISGSHVATFFFMISALFFWIKNKRFIWIKYILGICFVWFYVLMAGAPPSAVRAAIMFSILGYGIIFNKTGGALNQLFATAFILLCAQPMWLYAVGFQLSFVAVLSLILFYKPIYNLWPQTNRMGKGLWGAVAASLSAELLVAPLVVYYFHLFPLTFLIANVIAWILMSFLLVAGTAIIALSWWPPVAFFIAHITTFLTSRFNQCIAWLQGLNPTSFRYLQISFTEMLLLYALITFAAISILQKNTRAILATLMTGCLLLGFFCADEWSALKQNKLAIFNSKGQNKIEYIHGKKHQSFQENDYSEYAIKAAYTGWQAWREDTQSHNKCFLINEKKVLILDSESISETFSVDILVLRRSLKEYSFRNIQSLFTPKTIVPCGDQSNVYISKWWDSCTRAGIELYILKADGAIVIE